MYINGADLVDRTTYKNLSLNKLDASDQYRRLKMLALIRYEWINLPETCSARFLEDALYMEGKAGLVFDPDAGGFITVKVAVAAPFNIYGEASRYNCYAIGYNKFFSAEDCILVRNNYLEKPTGDTIYLYANRITMCERAIETNLGQQKFPGIVLADEKTEPSLRAAMAKVENGEPYIIANKNIMGSAIENLKHVDFKIPYVADKLMIAKQKIIDECLTFLGINNTNTEKRERLIQSEVDSNLELVSMCGEAGLVTRMEACEIFNKRYNQNLSVKIRTPDEILDYVKNGGVGDGELHDRA